MTLNITVLGHGAIYQSVDYRLFNTVTKEPLDLPSTKAVILHGLEWTGFITYTGIGLVGDRHTSDFVQSWLPGVQPTLDEVAERVRVAGSDWIRRYARGRRHTFVVAGFVGDTARAAVVSNFQKWHGVEDGEVADEFFTTHVSCDGHPEVIVTGRRELVSRQQRRQLQRLVDRHGSDNSRIRRALANINAQAAAQRPEFVSEACFVYSQDRYGYGHEEVFGRTATTFPHLMPPEAREAIDKVLEEHFGEGGWTMGGATFARSGARPEPSDCELLLDDSRNETPLQLTVLAAPPGGRATPRAVNVHGVIVGEGAPSRGGRIHPLVWSKHQELTTLPCLGPYGGRAVDVNESGLIVGVSEGVDGASKACIWDIGHSATDIGSPVARHSGTASINGSGTVAGWLSVHESEGGQSHFRPTRWSFGRPPQVLEDLKGGWGEAVHVSQNDTCLIRVHHGRRVEPGLWTDEDVFMLGLPSPDVVGYYPRRVTSGGVVVGTSIREDGLREIATWSDPEGWRSFGTSSHGREVTGSDEFGHLVGYETLDGYRIPWSWASSGDFKYLPHYRYHHHVPSAISDRGWIVGTASADNCRHPLLWSPESR